MQKNLNYKKSGQKFPPKNPYPDTKIVHSINKSQNPSTYFLSIKDKFWILLILLMTCFLFYGNTLSLKYALDDTIVITGNEFTKKGFNGINEILSNDMFTGYFGKGQSIVAGGRYRPLSLITYAIEYQFFGENPTISHLINILLLAITGFLIFFVFNHLLKYYFKEKLIKIPSWWKSVPFIMAILFIAHPIHTEVIANIKGRDEILALLFSLLSLWFFILWLEKKRIGMMVLIGISFFLGLMSKENTLTFLIVIPLAIYYFTKFSFKEILKGIIPITIAIIIFFIIRQSVIGSKVSPLANDLMNNPFVGMSILQKYSTILYTLGLYIKLLFIPHPLTYDYYPYHIPIINSSDLNAIIPLILYLVLLVFAIVSFKKRNPYSFAIFLFLVTLSITSNVFFPIGIFMNERFIYISSLAFCFALSWFLFFDIPRFFRNKQMVKILTFTVLGVILILFAYKTTSRNRNWYDSKTLFLNDVHISSNSAKGNAVAGEYLIYEAEKSNDKTIRDSLLNQSIIYLKKAIEIYPKQINALFNLAAAYYEKDSNYQKITEIYKTILYYLPKEQHVYTNFITIIEQCRNTDEKIKCYKELYKIDSMRFDINFNLGIILLYNKKEITGSIPYLKQAVVIDPNNADAQIALGEAYAFSSQWEKAIVALLEAKRLSNNPTAKLIKNIGIIFQKLNNNAKAKEYLDQAAQLAK
ncbi:MAG: tetratricopeptide repeat protein [Bacteroidetes bacterium]|nr:tetratricopeptide repeat protein [Bacteroidota bacterium]